MTKLLLRFKGGKGSGNFGHAGRKGKIGGSSNRGYEGDARFEDRLESATGRALYSGEIAINAEHWRKLPDNSKKSVLAHEVAHNTIEHYINNNMEEWNRAERTLKLREREDGRKLFVGGVTRLNEAFVEVVAAYLTGNTFGGISQEKQTEINQWAKSVIRNAGYNEMALKRDIDRLYNSLNSQ